MSCLLHSRYVRGALWAVGVVLLGGIACGESEDSTSLADPAAGDGSREGQGAGEQQGPDCFENPTNHFELINACTKAVRVERSPSLLLLEADGSLPAPP